MFNVVKQANTKLYKKIVEQIEKLLVNGILEPGDKLPSEKEIAKKTMTSRASVREALCALKLLGVVDSKRGRGNYIKQSYPLIKDLNTDYFEEESPSELLEVRKIFETEIAFFAAKRANEKDILDLEESIEKSKSMIEKFSINGVNIPDLKKANNDFHIKLTLASHNNILVKIQDYFVSYTSNRIWSGMMEKKWKDLNSVKTFFYDHVKIFNSVKNKDFKLAKKFMREHLSRVNHTLFEK